MEVDKILSVLIAKHTQLDTVIKNLEAYAFIGDEKTPKTKHKDSQSEWFSSDLLPIEAELVYAQWADGTYNYVYAPDKQDPRWRVVFPAKSRDETPVRWRKVKKDEI